MAAVAWHTGAHVAVLPLVAGGSVVAGIVLAFADGRAAVLAGVSRWAGAFVIVHAIRACATILAGVVGALVNVVLTVGSGEALRALAHVGVHKVHTLSTVGAWVGGAVVDLLLTVESGIAERTLAVVSSLWVVSTASAVKARPIGTGHGTELTVIAIEARGAGTFVCVFLISAASPIPAGVVGTFVDLNPTAGPREAGFTGAGVATLASIGTSGSIHAGLVVCAVVEILVAEEATPSLQAVTLPRLLAGAVKTSWVADAVITVTPTEANSTLAFTRLVTESMLLATTRKTDWFCAVGSLPS